MPSSAVLEHFTPALAPDTALQEAAIARGISLEPHRLVQLTDTAARMHASAQIYESHPDWEKPMTVFSDTRNDVEVGRAMFSDRFGATASKVDFAPILDGEGDLVSGTTFASPEHATLFSLMAVQGLQNYVLLVDAGVIEKPAILFGSTNPQMAIVAERVGLLSDIARQNPGRPAEAHKMIRQTPRVEVSGSFDEISERLFSEDTRRLEKLLARRMAAEKGAGETALSS